MTQLERELAANFLGFQADWTAQAQANWQTLKASNEFADSYRRIAALHAWKSFIILPKLSTGSAAFFLEAHNDALVSHVSASTGAWRSALQALRSCVENSMSALYYKDHPVELQQWLNGKFRIGFTELATYFGKHPALHKFSSNLTGIDVLKSEYATLSKAVHASATDFRMTDSAAQVLLWSTDKARVGSWATREKKVIEAICLLLISTFREDLTGASHTPLREILYFTVSASKRSAVKREFHIAISKPS